MGSESILFYSEEQILEATFTTLALFFRLLKLIIFLGVLAAVGIVLIISKRKRRQMYSDMMRDAFNPQQDLQGQAYQGMPQQNPYFQGQPQQAAQNPYFQGQPQQAAQNPYFQGQPQQAAQNPYFQGQPQFAQEQPIPDYQTPQQFMQPGVEPDPGMEIPATPAGGTDGTTV